MNDPMDYKPTADDLRGALSARNTPYDPDEAESARNRDTESEADDEPEDVDIAIHRRRTLARFAAMGPDPRTRVKPQ